MKCFFNKEAFIFKKGAEKQNRIPSQLPISKHILSHLHKSRAPWCIKLFGKINVITVNLPSLPFCNFYQYIVKVILPSLSSSPIVLENNCIIVLDDSVLGRVGFSCPHGKQEIKKFILTYFFIGVCEVVNFWYWMPSYFKDINIEPCKFLLVYASCFSSALYLEVLALFEEFSFCVCNFCNFREHLRVLAFLLGTLRQCV